MAVLKIKDPEGERTVPLDKDTMTVGRAQENEIPLRTKQSSRRHCQIERVDGRFKLVDLESRNGVRVNGKYVNQHILTHGDRVQIGDTVLEFDDPTSLPQVTAPMVRAAAVGEPTARTLPVQSPGEMKRIAEEQLRVKSFTDRKALPTEPRAALAARRRESRSMRTIAGVAGVGAAVGLLALIVWAASREPEAIIRGRSDYQKALHLKDSKPDVALQYVNRIPREAGEWYRKAQTLKKELNVRRHKNLSGIAREIKDAFGPLKYYAETHPDKYEEILARAKAFEDQFGEQLSPTVRNWIEFERDRVRRDIRARKVRDLAGLKKNLEQKRAKRLFGQALGVLKNKRARHIKDVEMTGAIDKMIGELIAEAGRHFASQDKAAQDLMKEKKDAEAQAIYAELITNFADGHAEHPEFKVTIQAIRARLGMTTGG